IIRKRVVAAGFDEVLTVINHTGDHLELELELQADADFADLFEVKDALAKKGGHYRRVSERRLILGYRRDGFRRETWISTEAGVLETGLRFRVRIEPQGRWTTRIEVRAGVHALSEISYSEPEAPGRRELEQWLAAAPGLRSDWRTLELTYEQS